MAKIANPRKQFQFSIEITGGGWPVISPSMNFLCQQVTTPDVEITQDEHGDTNYTIKTGGIRNTGNISIEKISSALGPDNYFWFWADQVQDAFFGGGLLPEIYKREVVIQQFSVDGVTVINQWECIGCWPTRINGVSYNRAESGNTVESIELSCDSQRRF